MNDTLTLLLAGIVGMLLGMVFFGGLWWTIRKGISSNYFPVWFLGSFILRMGVVLGGFFLVSAGHWERLVACLVGFFAARLLVARLTRLTTLIQPAVIPRNTHAP